MTRLAFFGTPVHAAQFLERLLSDDSLGVEIALVVTQEDKPTGRSQELTPSHVKSLAELHGIEVLHAVTPEDLSKRAIDLAFVFAYGRILPMDLLEAPKHGFWNLHLSLLPQFRGATPTVFPLILGQAQTGATLMQMDAKMDEGAIIAQVPYSIGIEDTQMSLIYSLADLAYSEVAKALRNPSKISTQPQDHSLATYTRTLKKDDGFVPFELVEAGLKRGPASGKSNIPEAGPLSWYLRRNPHVTFTPQKADFMLYNLWRGLDPWPGLWTIVTINGIDKRLKFHKMSFTNNLLTIETVQLEGKSLVSFDQFESAYHIFNTVV